MTEQQHWNAVFIATSMDGFIAGKDGDISWLDTIPIPEGTDMGYHAFMDRTDAILMGRISFETVLVSASTGRMPNRCSCGAVDH